MAGGITQGQFSPDIQFSGGGAKNFSKLGDLEGAKTSDILQGKSVTWGDTGAIGGLVDITETNPLAGSKTLEYECNATAAASVNDWIKIEEVIEDAYKGRVLEFRSQFQNELPAGSVQLIFKAQTTGEVLYSEFLPHFTDTNNKADEFSFRFRSPSDGLVDWGLHILGAQNSAKVRLDEITITPDLREIQETVFIEKEDSMVRLHTSNGHGSTNNKIRRFSNLVERLGSAITYNDSVADGALFTVEENGVYHISYTDIFNAAGHFGISRNSTELTTFIYDINDDDRLISGITETNGRQKSVTWSGYLYKGDEIRPHTSGAGDTNTDRVQFTITKIGSTHAFPAIKDQKIEIPTSNMRFLDIEGRGTGNEATTLLFNTLDIATGDAISHSSSNGSLFTIQKAGVVSISSDVRITAGSGHTCAISRAYNPDGSMPQNEEILQAVNTDSTAAGVNLNWTGKVEVGDVFRIHATTNPSFPNVAMNRLDIFHFETDISVAVNNIEPQYGEEDSYITLGGDYNRASTNVNVLYATSVIERGGAGIKYVPSSVNGDSFEILEEGLYQMHASWNGNAGADLAFTKNASILNNSPSVLPETERITLSFNNSGTVMETAGSAYLKVGDIVRLHSGGVNQANTSYNTWFIGKQAKPSVIGIDGRPVDAYKKEEDTLIEVGTGNGFGSSASAIRRFSSLNTVSGSAVTYSDSPTEGGTFLINEDGKYYVSYTMRNDVTTNNAYHGISKNSTQLSTNVRTITQEDILILSDSDSEDGGYNTISGMFDLQAGDILRVHYDNVTPTNANPNEKFIIHKTGSLIRSIPLVDSTIDIPTSEIRMETAGFKGSTDTAVIGFNNISKVSGEGLSVLTTAANGTVITAEKDGTISLSSIMRFTAAADVSITKNQVNLTTTPTLSEKLAHSTTSSNTYDENLAAVVPCKAGDQFRIVSPSGVISGGDFHLFQATHQETEVAVAISNVQPQFEDVDSAIELQVAAGTVNKRFKFDNIKLIKGSSVEYLEDSGSVFLIKEDGNYQINASVGFQGQSSFNGICKNVDSTFVPAQNGPLQSEVLSYDLTETNQGGALSWSGQLKEGDRISLHHNTIDSVSTGNYGPGCRFNISKQAKPSIADVDITPFAEINQQVFQATEWNNAGALQLGTTGTGVTKGTTTIDSVRERRIGDSLEVTVEYHQSGAGAVGTGDVFVKIPGNRKIDMTKVSQNTTPSPGGYNNKVKSTNVGTAQWSAADTTFVSAAVSVYDNQHVRINGSGSHGNNTTVYPGADFNGWQIFDTADSYLVMRYTVPIEGWDVYDSEYETVYSVEDNENVFSAKISNDGTAEIISQSVDFIESVNRTATGDVSVSFVPGFFSETPSITTVSSTTDSSTTGELSFAISASINGARIITRNSSGTANDLDFSITAIRQGSDYKDLQRQIVQLADFPKVNGGLSQELTVKESGNTLLDQNGEVRWNPSATSWIGDRIIEVEDDAANSRTKFVATRDCRVHASFTYYSGNAEDHSSIYKNGIEIIRGTDVESADFTQASVSVLLKEGDYLSFGAQVFVRNTVDDCTAIILAEADELKGVGNLSGGENNFSARVDLNGNLISSSSDFIQATSRTSTGLYRVDFIPGFFTEIPACTASVLQTGTSGEIHLNDISTSGITFNIINNSNADSDRDFSFQIQRQGTDYRDAQEYILELDSFPRINRTISEHAFFRGNGGQGSINNRIPYFDVEQYNTLSTLGVIDNSSSLGWSFTATKKCRVHMVVSGNASGGNNWGISKNSTELSTSIITMNDADRVSGSKYVGQSPTTDSGAETSFVGILEPGDILRPHTEDASSENSDHRCTLTILVEGQELERVSTVEQEENIFSARIGNNGTASVISESVSFIQSVSRTSAGNVDIVFTPGFFSEVPSINTEVEISSPREGNVTSVSVSGCTIRTFNTSSNASVDENFTITIQRQGADYRSIKDVSVVLPESPVKWQKKTLSSNQTSTGVVSDLTFNNLEIGKTYRIGGQLSILGLSSSVNSKESRIDIDNGSTRIIRTGGNSGDTGTYIFPIALNTVFIASDTTLTVDVTSLVNTYMSANTTEDSYMILEELPLHEQTSQWT